MMLEEVLVRLENRKFLDVASGERLTASEDHMRQHIQNVMGGVEEGAPIVEGEWLNRVETKEGTSPECDKLGVIGRTPFRVHDQGLCLP